MLSTKMLVIGVAVAFLLFFIGWLVGYTEGRKDKKKVDKEYIPLENTKLIQVMKP